MPGEWERHKRRKEANLSRKVMPMRRTHQSLPRWVKRLLNPWMKRYGDPGDATDPARRR